MIKGKLPADAGEEIIIKYFPAKKNKCRVMCSKCSCINRVDGFQKKKIKCSYCRKIIDIPKSPVSRGAMIDRYLIRGFNCEDDKTLTLNAYSLDHHSTKLKILKPKYLDNQHEIAIFLKAILEPKRSRYKILRVGRDNNIVFQEIQRLQKDEYPEFLDFKKAFIAGKESIHTDFLHFVLTAYPRFSARNFGVDINEKSIRKNKIIAYKKDRVQLAAGIDNNDKTPELLIDLKFSTQINKERMKKADSILQAKYPNRENKYNGINNINIKSENYAQNRQKDIPNKNAIVHKKVIISFSKQRISGWRVMNINTYINQLDLLFKRELAQELGDDHLLITYYLKYLNDYANNIYSLRKEREVIQILFEDDFIPDFVNKKELFKLKKELRMLQDTTLKEKVTYRKAVKKGVDTIIRKREKNIHDEMNWKKYFNEHRREYFENFVISADAYYYFDNPMMHCHIDLTQVNIGKDINKHYSSIDPINITERRKFNRDDGVNPDEYPCCAEFAKNGGVIHANVLFQPLHDVLLVYQLKTGTEAGSECLRDAIRTLYRTLAKFAVTQLVFVKLAIHKNADSNEIRKRYTGKSDSIENCLKVITDIQKEIVKSNYRKHAIRLPLPSLYKYDTESLNVKTLVKYVNLLYKIEVESMYDILMEEVNNCPFFNYPISKTKLEMQTPVGSLSLRSIYKARLGNYENTDVFVKSPFVNNNRVARIEDSLKLEEF